MFKKGRDVVVEWFRYDREPESGRWEFEDSSIILSECEVLFQRYPLRPEDGTRNGEAIAVVRLAVWVQCNQ